jgi:hypothetical protein
MADNNTGYDYTMVLDGDLKGQGSLENGGTELNRAVPEPVQAKPAAKAAAPEKRMEPGDFKEKIDRLYYDYEKMCLKWPTILDMDDAYPHSYQWRIGDKYDLGKMEALEEAIREGIKIENTEAYRKYISSITHRKVPQMSWD